SWSSDQPPLTGQLAGPAVSKPGFCTRFGPRLSVGSAVRPPPINGVDCARAAGAADDIVSIMIKIPAIQRRIWPSTLLFSCRSYIGGKWISQPAGHGQGQGQARYRTHVCENSEVTSSTFSSGAAVTWHLTLRIKTVGGGRGGQSTGMQAERESREVGAASPAAQPPMARI